MARFGIQADCKQPCCQELARSFRMVSETINFVMKVEQ
jgi:hypothetical protein